jgi:nicotinamidase/pyrazinamidase
MTNWQEISLKQVKEKMDSYLETVGAGIDDSTSNIPKLVESYPIDNYGFWDVVGGRWGGLDPGDPAGRYGLGVVEGRYADVLSWAVKQSRWRDEWGDGTGFIRKHSEMVPGHVPPVPELHGYVLDKKLLNDKGARMKTIAWNVDTQLDFMSPLGKLPVPGAPEIELNLGYLTLYLREKGIRLVNTGDWHSPDSEEISETPDYMKTFPAHCLIGTPGAEYVVATKPFAPVVVDWRAKNFDLGELASGREIVLYKDAFDIFAGNPHADSVLSALSPERVIVYGVATNVCVDYAVRGLLQRKKEVYVVEDAIQGLPGLPSPIEKWKELGARVIRTNDLRLEPEDR